ncbi:P-loop containing nucleoside triphosphate hydrolase protein [Nemania sp. FL0031]|nr:P-loop containing nucleoside triphosphate hydrolase protein [Nemania sp. FL0031]
MPSSTENPTLCVMSGVEMIGIVASTAQLAELGLRVVCRISHTCQQIRDYPNILSKRLNSMEQLVKIAEDIQSIAQVDTVPIKTILSSTIEDAKSLREILDSLSHTQGTNKAQRCLKVLCRIAKEAQILKLLHQIEERKGALLLCIALANIKLLGTVDQSISDLSLSAQDAFREIPNIKQSLKDTSSQLQGLIKRERLRHGDWQVGGSSTARVVDLALSGRDNRLGEMIALQESTVQPKNTILKSVPSAPGDDDDDDSDFAGIQSHPFPAPTSSTRSWSMATQETTHSSESTDSTLIGGQGPSRSFLVPVSDNRSLFINRAKIMERIEDFFDPDDRSEQKRLVLTGLGGVGKTQIATAFAYDSYASGHYSTVLWIYAINRDEVLKSFTEIAKSLGLYPEAGASESAEAMALALLRWLGCDHLPRWLLIFDNMDNLDFNIAEFFPNVPWGSILITSRCMQAGRLGVFWYTGDK